MVNKLLRAAMALLICIYILDRAKTYGDNWRE